MNTNESATHEANQGLKKTFENVITKKSRLEAINIIIMAI
jgi:hypothetical protein